MISETFLLVEEIRPGAPEVDDLRTSISIFLQPRTFKAVKGVAYAFAATHDALVLVITKRTFVTNAYERCGTHIAVAYRTFAIAFVAEAPYRYTRLFTAHDKIAAEVNIRAVGGRLLGLRMVTRHV